MSVELVHLWPLAGLPGFVLLYFWHRRSIAPLSAGRRRLSLALRGLILLLLVLALTEPRLIRERRQQFVFWLADVSRSVGDAAREKGRLFAVTAAKEGGVDHHAFIPFAGRPALATDEKGLLEIAPQTLENDATDLAAALNFAAASTPPGYAKTVVLFSDGQETRGEIATLSGKLREAGMRIFTVPVAPPDRPEVLVRSVAAPRQANEGEPFKVTVEIVSNRDTEATLDVFKNGPRVSSKTVTLQKGVNRFETTQVVSGEKVYEFAAAIRAKEDTVADNNQAAAFVQAAGKSKVLLLADKPDQARYLAHALKQEGVLLDVRPAAGAPTEMGDLQNYDLLVIDNVPATDLSPQQMTLYASYIRDFGGGLLMLGGEQSFGLGGYYRTPIEEVLPVRCDFEKEQENPSLGLVLVIDRSGSMDGEKIEMAKEAAKAAVELLSPKDYVGVVGFDHEAFWVSELQSAVGKGDALQKIGTMTPGGGTNILPGMEMAFSRLSGSSAKLKHIILLTDGMSEPGPFQELATQIAQQRITLSTVAVGEGADQALLQKIAEWGNGRYYFTDNARSIPQIFAKETMSASKSAIKEAPFLPVQTGPADFLSGIDFQSAPFLLGYVTTRLKPTAETWLLTEKGEPLLATWRYGLGQVGAFASDARNRWAVEWLKWDGYGKFWAQTARKLMRTGSLKPFPSQLVRQGDDFCYSVDSIDERGRYLSDVTGEILLLDPDGRSRKIPLEAEAPGRFSARWPARRGVVHAQVLLKRGGEIVDRQYVSASTGYPDEFLLRGLDETRLRRLSAENGGTYDPKPTELRNDRAVPVEWELWPWLAGAALLLFIADVAAKRWPDSRTPRLPSSTPAPRQPSLSS